MANLKQAQLYVGTYRKYNEGSIFGKWMTLSEYDNKEEFLAACHELHKDEDDPEFMFQDYDELPECFYCESYISPKFWDLLEATNDMSEDELETFCEWCDYQGHVLDSEDADAIVEKFNDSHMGDFEDGSGWSPLKNYAYDLAPDMLGLSRDAFERISSYIDFDAIARDLECNGYYDINGHVFMAV